MIFPHWLVLLIFAAILASPRRARASNPYLELPENAELRASRAQTYANLANVEVMTELVRRGIAYRPVVPGPRGVRFPIRLRGRLRGIAIHSSLPKEHWRETPFEILDARLALALDDLCALLERHDIVEIVHFTMYRPPGELDIEVQAPHTRHPGGMAIDVGALRKRSGAWLAVGPHWPAAIGRKTCGPGARELTSRPARELLSIVCEVADARIFHYVLTPHFDRAHADHLHLEIKPGVKWFLVN